MELPAEDILDSISSSIVVSDPNSPDNSITYVNPAFEKNTGYSSEEAVGRNCRFLQGPDTDQPDIESLRRALADGREWSGVLRNYRKSGEPFWNELLISAVHDKEGSIKNFISVQRDVSARVEAEARQREGEKRVRSVLLRFGSDVLTILDSEGTVTYDSPAVEQALGYGSGERVGRNGLDMIHPDDRKRFAEGFASVIDGHGSTPPAEYRILHADGTWHYFERVITNMLEEPGVEGIVVSSRNINERKRLEHELQHQALHDSLTGLPNRTLFNDRLKQSLERTSRSGETMAVMFLDLDDFKGVNDSLGHSMGDEFLAAVAVRLGECLRLPDTVARMGGDEFTILLDGVDSEAEASQVAERIIDRFRFPLTLEDWGVEREVSTTVSIGVVLVTPGTDSRTTAEEILKWADTALYRAKESGKGHYLFFHPHMGERSLEDLEETSLEEE